MEALSEELRGMREEVNGMRSEGRFMHSAVDGIRSEVSVRHPQEIHHLDDHIARLDNINCSGGVRNLSAPALHQESDSMQDRVTELDSIHRSGVVWNLPIPPRAGAASPPLGLHWPPLPTQMHPSAAPPLHQESTGDRLLLQDRVTTLDNNTRSEVVCWSLPPCCSDAACPPLGLQCPPSPLR